MLREKYRGCTSALLNFLFISQLLTYLQIQTRFSLALNSIRMCYVGQFMGHVLHSRQNAKSTVGLSVAALRQGAAGRSTALAQALAPPCLALRIALLRYNNVNRK